jgi:hypothetical protein
MGNVSDKTCTENQNTHFTFNNFFFFLFRKPCVYEMMWQNIVKSGRPPMTLWEMRIACCIPKTTNLLSAYVMLIVFPLQQCVHECSSVLHYSTLSALLHLSTHSYLYKNKENSVGGVCSRHGGNECTVLVGKPEGITKFYVGVYWVGIVRRILKECV